MREMVAQPYQCLPACMKRKIDWTACINQKYCRMTGLKRPYGYFGHFVNVARLGHSRIPCLCRNTRLWVLLCQGYNTPLNPK